jgi:hypothetical protein
MYNIPTLPLPIDLETKTVLRQLNAANKMCIGSWENNT